MNKIRLLKSVLISNHPEYMILYVTNRCNSKCKTCFNWAILNKNTENELTLDEINKISLSIGSLQYITLGGGEPFLRDDLPEICEIFYKNNKPQIFSIPTNALTPEKIRNFTERILLKCKNSIIRINLSLDGVGKLHDKIRGVTGNFNAFLKTYNLLHDLKERYNNLQINIGTTFSSYNQNEIEKIIQFVKKLDVSQHNITFIRGNPKNKGAKEVSVKKYQELVSGLEMEYKKKYRKFDFSTKKLFDALSVLTCKTVLKNLKSGKRVWECYPIKKLLVIDAVGNVYPCEYFHESLGNLRNNGYDLRKLLMTKKAEDIKKKVKERACNCTWECAIQNSLVYNLLNYPKIIMQLLRA